VRRGGNISRKAWRTSTILWLNGCTDDVFARLTVEDVVKKGFKRADAEEMLSRARQGRGV
jgi:hypothetical protein